MDTDARDIKQDRRDVRRARERNRMPVHKVKSPRSGERLIKVAVRRLHAAAQTRLHSKTH